MIDETLIIMALIIDVIVIGLVDALLIWLLINENE